MGTGSDTPLDLHTVASESETQPLKIKIYRIEVTRFSISRKPTQKMKQDLQIGSLQGRIQDSPQEEAPTLWGCQHMIWPKFPKNCIKLRKFWAVGCRPLAWIRHRCVPSTWKQASVNNAVSFCILRGNTVTQYDQHSPILSSHDISKYVRTKRYQ